MVLEKPVSDHDPLFFFLLLFLLFCIKEPLTASELAMDDGSILREPNYKAIEP